MNIFKWIKKTLILFPLDFQEEFWYIVIKDEIYELDL